MNLSNHTYPLAGDQSEGAANVATGLSSVLAQWHRLVASVAAKRARNREMRALYRLGDRELWDLGLSRSDLLRVENGSYHRGS
jgi:uncharacterized protein YjiS (DUF1127 family)